MNEYAFEGAKRSSATVSWSFATQTLASDAGLPFSSAIAPSYQSTVIAAFARWASVSGLVFTQVADAASVPIRIGFGSFTDVTELGETDFRYGGGLIGNDTLIRLLDPAVAPLHFDPVDGYGYRLYGVTLFQVALHEIGHALGLDHSSDPTTIMYPYASALNTDLAAGDIEGINALYPLFTVVARNPVQIEGGPGQVDTFDFTITRYSDPAVALTINYNVGGAAYPSFSGSVAAVAGAFAGGSYPAGQLTFAAGSTTATLSIQVAGNALPQADQGFAIRLSTGNPIDSVIVRGTVNALVLDDDGFGQVNGGSIGVYRFFDTSDGTHFFSTSQAERNAIIQSRPDLTYEGLGLTAIGSPAADPAAAPVFRFFDTVDGTHFYSASTTERDAIAATRSDLVFEGTAFYEHAVAQPGDTAVYRFFETRDGTHFLTSSATERAAILANRPDLHDEGIAFYAPAS